MNGRSRSALFLIEQLIVITIFALCSTVCVKIFIGSYLTASGTRDINHALAAAKNGAECYKAYGDPVKAANFLGGEPNKRDSQGAMPLGRGAGQSPAGIVYYNSAWQVCPQSDAAYKLRLEELLPSEAVSPLLCALSVSKADGEGAWEKIIGFTVAAKRREARDE